jgi:hypothetical protein
VSLPASHRLLRRGSPRRCRLRLDLRREGGGGGEEDRNEGRGGDGICEKGEEDRKEGREEDWIGKEARRRTRTMAKKIG